MVSVSEAAPTLFGPTLCDLHPDPHVLSVSKAAPTMRLYAQDMRGQELRTAHEQG